MYDHEKGKGGASLLSIVRSNGFEYIVDFEMIKTSQYIEIIIDPRVSTWENTSQCAIQTPPSNKQSNKNP
jgi:hypothetical protein